jgi:hypothetical protein
MGYFSNGFFLNERCFYISTRYLALLASKEVGVGAAVQLFFFFFFSVWRTKGFYFS